MPGEFLQGIQIGANIANLRVMQQERMMQLRSQAALNAVRERQLAAEAAMYDAHRQDYLMDVQEKLKDQADAKLYLRLVQDDTEVYGVPEDVAIKKHLPALLVRNQRLGKEMAGAIKASEEAKIVGQARPLDPSQVEANQARALASTASAALSTARKEQIEKGSAAVTPTVQLIEGKKFLVNPKTGAVHEISKTISKRQFIADHTGDWMRNNLGMSADEAAQSMSAFYDKYLAESPAQPPSGLPVGTIVRQGGKRFRHEGGGKYVEVP